MRVNCVFSKRTNRKSNPQIRAARMQLKGHLGDRLCNLAVAFRLPSLALRKNRCQVYERADDSMCSFMHTTERIAPFKARTTHLEGGWALMLRGPLDVDFNNS